MLLKNLPFFLENIAEQVAAAAVPIIANLVVEDAVGDACDEASEAAFQASIMRIVYHPISDDVRVHAFPPFPVP